MSAWEQEEYRLWLGSLGWYGKNQVRFYHALLLAHRVDRPAPTVPPAPLPVSDGVIVGPDGLRYLDGWPEWSPGVFGPVPITVVEAVRRGEMWRNPDTGFYEQSPRRALIDVWYGADPDVLEDAESVLPLLDGFLGAILPEPARSHWRRVYGDFVEGRMPLDDARALLGALIRASQQARAIARKAPTVRRAVAGRRPTSSPTSSAGERAAEWAGQYVPSAVVPEIRAGATWIERQAARLTGAAAVGAAAAGGVMGVLAESRSAARK